MEKRRSADYERRIINAEAATIAPAPLGGWAEDAAACAATATDFVFMEMNQKAEAARTGGRSL